MLQEVIGSTLLIMIIAFLWRIAMRHFRILDKPGHDVPKRPRVPTIQGIGLLLAVVILTLLYHVEYFWAPYLRAFRIGIGVLAGVNLIDELGRIIHPRYRIGPFPKMIVQFAVAAGAVWISGVGFTGIQLGSSRVAFHPLLVYILTIGRFVLCTNAINWFDGVYGLASGSSSIGFFTIGALLTRVVLPLYPEISGLKFDMLHSAIRYARIFAGITLLAAIMEFRPRGLVREVGTMPFGFALAYLSLLGGAKIGTVIVVLLLPLLDAVRVVIDRLHVRKQNPLKGDFTHLHYRLMALGRNRTEIRVVLRSLSAFLAILMLLQGGDKLSKMVIFVMVATIFFAINGYLYRVKKLPKEYLPGIKSDDDLDNNYTESP